MSEAADIAMALIRRFEGCVLEPYLCPAGVATIGYGTTRYEDGTAVSLLDPPVSQGRAESLLTEAVLRMYLPAVAALCPGVDSPQRVAALVDFTYNLGINALRVSTLRKRVNAGAWGSVPDELRKWIYAGGRRLSGLAIRREAEAGLI